MPTPPELDDGRESKKLYSFDFNDGRQSEELDPFELEDVTYFELLPVSSQSFISNEDIAQDFESSQQEVKPDNGSSTTTSLFHVVLDEAEYADEGLPNDVLQPTQMTCDRRHEGDFINDSTETRVSEQARDTTGQDREILTAINEELQNIKQLLTSLATESKDQFKAVDEKLATLKVTAEQQKDILKAKSSSGRSLESTSTPKKSKKKTTFRLSLLTESVLCVVLIIIVILGIIAFSSFWFIYNDSSAFQHFLRFFDISRWPIFCVKFQHLFNGNRVPI